MAKEIVLENNVYGITSILLLIEILRKIFSFHPTYKKHTCTSPISKIHVMENNG